MKKTEIFKYSKDKRKRTRYEKSVSTQNEKERNLLLNLRQYCHGSYEGRKTCNRSVKERIKEKEKSIV